MVEVLTEQMTKQFWSLGAQKWIPHLQKSKPRSVDEALFLSLTEMCTKKFLIPLKTKTTEAFIKEKHRYLLVLFKNNAV